MVPSSGSAFQDPRHRRSQRRRGSAPGLGGTPRRASRAARRSARRGTRSWSSAGRNSSGGRRATGAAAACSPRRSTCIVRRWPAGTSSATRRTRSCRAASPPPTCGASSPKGVFATVKHFVATTRSSSGGRSARSSTSERAGGAVPRSVRAGGREGGALAIMTAYNRLNGRWVTEQPGLLRSSPGRVGVRGARDDRLVRGHRHPGRSGPASTSRCRVRVGLGLDGARAR